MATAESRVAAYRDDLGEVTRSLDAAAEVPRGNDRDASRRRRRREHRQRQLSEEAARTVQRSGVDPEAGALARIEARQLALVEKLTHFADQRAARAEAALRKLGLDARSMIAATREGRAARSCSSRPSTTARSTRASPASA